MGTTSSVPAFKQTLTAAITTAVDAAVDVTYGWQPWRGTDTVFLGAVEGESTIPTMKAGRKYRQESYRVDLLVRTVDPAGNPRSAATVEARAYAMLADIEDVLADDVQIGTVTIQRAWLSSWTSTVVDIPDGKGLGCEIAAVVSVEARLT